jgi:Effector protein
MVRSVLQTDFEHVIVKVDEEEEPFYFSMVQEALAKIANKPLGLELLQNIQRDGQANFGYKVAILRPAMAVKQVQGTTVVGDGNVAVRSKEDDACNGIGTVTMVKYNHNTMWTPDGNRPNFIGLAHELTHAWHNLRGIAKPEVAEEEHFTVGLGAYSAERICENTIRAEHGVPLRTTYTLQ